MKPVLAVEIGSVSPTLSMFGSFGDFVSAVVKNAFVLAGVVCFVLLIFGGFGVIVGAGDGDAKKMEQAKGTMTAAVIGLLLVVGSLFIVQVIRTITGVDILSPNL